MTEYKGFAYRSSKAGGLWAQSTLKSAAALFDEVAQVSGGPGCALLASFDSMPQATSICMSDDTLTPPANTFAEAVQRLLDAAAPAALLVPPDDCSGPLAAQGGLVRVDASLVKTEEARTLLASEAAQNWTGFLAALQTLVGRPLPVAYPSELAAPCHLWLRDGLPTAADAGVPIYPWALFTADPLDLQRWGISGRSTYDWLLSHGVTADDLWPRLLASCPPQTWYTNLAMLNVLDDAAPLPDSAGGGSETDMMTAVICHVFYPEMLEELLGYAANVPAPRRLVITTDTQEKATAFEAAVAHNGQFADFDVRVVTTNRGRDISAFLLDCHDVLRDPAVGLVVKLHSKKSLQDPAAVSDFFQRHLFENLVGTRSQAAQIRDLFVKEPLLGMVMTPVIHMGLPTMGNGWTLNRGPADQVAVRLGFADSTSADVPGIRRLPFDDPTPLAPYGSMFWARREALAPLVNAGFAAEEFPDHADYRDGSSAHVLERLISYSVFAQGFYARGVQTERLAAITGLTLEAKVDALSADLPPFPDQQVRFLQKTRDYSPRRLRARAFGALQARCPRAASEALRIRAGLKRRLRAVLAR